MISNLKDKEEFSPVWRSECEVEERPVSVPSGEIWEMGGKGAGSEMRMRAAQRPELGGNVALVKNSAFLCM